MKTNNYDCYVCNKKANLKSSRKEDGKLMYSVGCEHCLNCRTAEYELVSEALDAYKKKILY